MFAYERERWLERDSRFIDWLDSIKIVSDLLWSEFGENLESVSNKVKWEMDVAKKEVGT